MNTRNKPRNFKSIIKARVAPADGPVVTTVPPSRKRWANLSLLKKTLDDSPSWLQKPALQGAIGRFIESIKSHKAKLKLIGRSPFENVEYDSDLEPIESEVLNGTLEESCRELAGFWKGHLPSFMGITLDMFSRSIDRELSYLRPKQSRGFQTDLSMIFDRQAEVANYEFEVLQCYRRIQNCLQGIISSIVVCLEQGIFNEGDMVALLDTLPRVESAPFQNGADYGTCTRGTREGVLSRIHTWIASPGSDSVHWISGMAGTGKTTIARQLCKELNACDRLAASFFCSRSKPGFRNVTSIIPAITRQLAEFSTPFRYVLCRALLESGLNQAQQPNMQINSLIVEPMIEMKHTLPDHPLVVVIDGLDECVDKEGTSQLLEALLIRGSDTSIKFVVFSRPEPEIRVAIRGQVDPATSRTILHELSRDVVQADIRIYLESSLSHRSSGKQLLECLEKAGVLFVYAAAMVEYICDLHEPWQLNYEPDILDTATRIKEKVDNMYNDILGAALTPGNPGLNDTQLVLYLVVCAHKPLSFGMIARLLKMGSTDRVWAALRQLWSVIHVYVSEGKMTAATLHPSFNAYLLDPSRSKDYYCDPEVYGNPMAQYCFEVLRDMRPQFNICNLESSHIQDSNVIGLKKRVRTSIPDELIYAARHWATHLCSTTVLRKLLLDLEGFLSEQLLLWMEVMNLRQHTHAMPQAIRLVQEWAGSSTECSASLRALLHDAWRFTTAFSMGALSASTPHIYVSLLPLWPERSPIVTCYGRRIRRAIKAEGTAMSRSQGFLFSICHFSDTPKSPTYSPDGMQIAVGVGHDVLLLSASTGKQALHKGPFKGHTDRVLAVRFSPSGTQIVSGSLDKSIRVWDTLRGKTVVGPIQGHIGHINSVDFSPDGTCIASGSQDGTVFTWDSKTGARLLGPLMGEAEITEVRYSPDGRWLAASILNSVVTWDVEDGRVLKSFRLNGNEGPLRSMDIHPDCTRIAAGSVRNCVYIWDVKSGQVVHGPLQPDDAVKNYEPFASVAFSPDGSHIASISSDREILLWETETGTLTRSPVDGLGHTDSITSLGFSPDGNYIVSGSYDNTIRLWGVQNTLHEPTFLPGHANPVTSISYSLDGAYIFSGSSEGTVRTWDSESGEMLRPTTKTNRWHETRALATYSPNGNSILSDSPEGLVLFDSRTGHITVGPFQLDQSIRSAVLSADGTRIILGSTNNNIHVLAASTGDTLLNFCPPITNQSDWAHITSIALSPNGDNIAVGSMHSSFSIHGSRSGKLLCGPFDGYTNNSYSLAFSPDGTRIVSGSFSAVHVRDMRTGEVLIGPLEGHKGWISSVAYSPDATYIVSGGRDNDIHLWDAHTGQSALGPIGWHTAPVRCVQFSPDGTRVASGSDDKTIRVTNVGEGFKYPLGSLPSDGSEWELNRDGWVIDNQGKLLVWIPPGLRTSLMRPRTELLISRKGWLRLDFSESPLGETWTECYKA